MPRSFGYQMQKMSEARSALMAPHSVSEAQSFAIAFDSCNHAFRTLNREQVLDKEMLLKIDAVQLLIDTAGVDDPTDEGTYVQRARQMSHEEKHVLATAINELADYFNREFFSD